MTAIRTFRYVRHHAIERYEELGWRRVETRLCHHDFWSIIMEWPGDGEPPEPAVEAAQ